jgi:hypothetical protein
MTEPRPEHRLDPEQDEYVRRLLADARHDEPMPTEVVDRLDSVLDGLADAPARPAPAPVRDLAAERRRRRVVQLLVAAAAVVAVGVGLGQLDLGSLATSGSDSESAAGGSSAADGQLESDREAVPDGPVRAAPDAFTGKPIVVTGRDLRRLAARGGAAYDVTLAELADADGTTFNDDVPAGEKASQFVATESDAAAPQASAPQASWFTCKKGPYGAGRLVAVEYRGNPAVVAVRPSTGDSVVVELLQCGTATVLRSVTVPTS